MACRVVTRRGLAAALALGLLAAVPVAAPARRPPSIAVRSVTVDRVVHTVDLRLRVCLSTGPRAKIAVTERRTLAGVVRASRRWVVPRAIEPTRIEPFACSTRWRVNWLIEPPLRGRGTYTASIRVRDAYGNWTPAVTVAVTSP